jgi:uncharacterized protein (TIGR02147 family)
MNFFDCLNYRDLLKGICEKKKRENSFFSYRWLSKRTGIASTGFLSLVIAGKRNISGDLALRLCEALKFNKKETDYFLALIRYNQTENPEEKKRFFEELLCLRPANANSIQADQQEYFNKWYYAAIRELISVIEVSDNYKQIAGLLIPRVSLREVREALELLLRLGFVYLDKNGIFKRTDTLITAAGSPIDPSAIRKYQGDTMDLAKNALYSVEKELRDISTVTLSTNKEGMRMIKARIEQCRSEIMAVAGQSIDSDRIIQLNIQLFPLCFKGRKGA